MVRITPFAALAALPLAHALSVTGSSGLQDTVRTAVAIDTPTAHQTLESGNILIHITRTEDLFSNNVAESDQAGTDEDNGHRLLLERVSHIMLNVRLDKDNGQLDINGAPVSLLPNQKEEEPVTIVKAETLALPKTVVDELATSQDMSVEKLKGFLSPGILSAQVIVQSEVAAGSAISSQPIKAEDGQEIGIQAQVAPATMRKINVWIKILDIDGQRIPHETSVHTNILQFLVSTSPTTSKLTSFHTVSVRPSNPTTPSPFQALNVPGPAILPYIPSHNRNPSTAGLVNKPAKSGSIWDRVREALRESAAVSEAKKAAAVSKGCHGAAAKAESAPGQPVGMAGMGIGRLPFRGGLAAAGRLGPLAGLRPDVGAALRDALTPHSHQSPEDAAVAANDGTTRLATHHVGMPGVSRTGRWADRHQHAHMHDGKRCRHKRVMRIVGHALLAIGGFFIALVLAVVMVPLAVLTNPVLAILAVVMFVVVRRRKMARRMRRQEEEAQRLAEEGQVRLPGEEGEKVPGQGLEEEEKMLVEQVEVVVEEEPLPRYEEKA